MMSPLPGMDPYLESHWGDVHASIVTYARDQLARQMPRNLKVRIEEYVAVEVEDESRDHLYVPDVRVFEQPGSTGSGGTQSGTAGATLVAEADEPLLVARNAEPPTQREIRILDMREGGRLVTAIEFLSITNKTTGREDYRRKQREILEEGANLVEIDLLRDGHWVLAIGSQWVRESHRGPYRVCVVRGESPNTAEMYQTSYVSRLPNIRIPLRREDSDAVLRLQPLLDQAYANGQYDDLDYRQEPEPPLMEEERTWVADLLKQAGKR